jgi:hypothetical protein
MRKWFLILTFTITLAIPETFSQEKKSFTLNGYLTLMPSVMFDSLFKPVSNDILIHNRLNFRYYSGNYLTFALELRNRILKGDMMSATTLYPEAIGNDPGLIDLSWNILERNSLIINTSVDRYWIDYNRGKFQIRIGRQRINWGQTLVWNPDDIFNTYSVFDFDYIERPGSDAVRLQYFPGSSSAIEVAVKADHNRDITAAALYRFNRWGYDIQVLAGYSGSEDFVAGAGWSGSIGSTSFRGEASWFQPVRNFSDTTGRGLFTAGLDRIFNDNSMVQFQVMYCNKPNSLKDFSSFYSGNMSSKDLAFSKLSAFGLLRYSVTPLFNLTVSAMWFPDLKGFFAGPSADYSLTGNIDLSMIWQYFYSRTGSYKISMGIGYLRLKYSF